MHKLKEGKYRSDIRKKFFTARLVRHWNTLPRQAEDAPDLAVFKGRLGKTLSSLVYCEVSLPMTGGVGTGRSLKSIPTA